MGTKNKANELYINRIYDAPVKLVWDAWTDPQKAAHWWGPRGFTITTHSKDLRVGGSWAYTMHGPDGVDYPNKTIYHEVEECAKLVYDHGGNDDRPPLFRVTVLFTEVAGKTIMEMTMALETPEAAKEIKKFIKQAGGNATWDRLGEYLAEKQNNQDIFLINRVFEAPIDLMFEMWTRPEHIAKWLAPTGFEMKFKYAQIESNGKSFYSMANADQSVVMYGKAHYLEIQKPNLIRYTQQFADQNENMGRHPLAPTWPETMLTTVRLTEEAVGLTRATIQWEVYGEASAEERAMFHNAKGGMTQGWTGSLDKLEDYLK